ncbi:MAG: hypothetical protein ABEI32_08755 [Halothece sp.]
MPIKRLETANEIIVITIIPNEGTDNQVSKLEALLNGEIIESIEYDLKKDKKQQEEKLFYRVFNAYFQPISIYSCYVDRRNEDGSRTFIIKFLKLL